MTEKIVDWDVKYEHKYTQCVLTRTYAFIRTNTVIIIPRSEFLQIWTYMTYVFGVSDKASFKPVSSATQTS